MWACLARPSLENAVKVWLTGGQTACWIFESVQMRVERNMLEVCNTLAGVHCLRTWVG